MNGEPQARAIGAESKPPNRLRLWLGIAIAVVGSLLVGHFLLAQRRYEEMKHEQAARGRVRRVESAVVVALAPLPVASPLVERKGKDAFGYPLSYVDQSALRSLLGHGRYRELSQYIEQFQRDFEADFHLEYFVNDSGDAFESSELELGPKLDAWVAATPSSFAPYLARGIHGLAVGHARRGGAARKDTDPENFEAMERAFTLAFGDLDIALAKNPRVIPALRGQIRIAFIGRSERGKLKQLAARAFAACPGCFQVRVAQQVGLEPRWGGSYEAMAKAAREADPALNPRFKLLAGYADIDRALGQWQEKQLTEALKSAEQACALGDNADFLQRKADVLRSMNDLPGALQALTRGLELRPHRADLLLARARVYSEQSNKDWQAAYEDLLTAARLDPAEEEIRRLLPTIAKGLTFLGWQAHEQGKDRDAMRFLDEAAELLPGEDVTRRRMAVLTSGFHDTDAEIAELERNVKADAHDFYAHERLDYALSKRRAWPRIAQMWSEYIAQNPDQGRAYLERAGTLHNQGQNAAAHADAARACELGVSAGCAIAARK
jgi:hypothetical protein